MPERYPVTTGCLLSGRRIRAGSCSTAVRNAVWRHVTSSRRNSILPVRLQMIHNGAGRFPTSKGRNNGRCHAVAMFPFILFLVFQADISVRFCKDIQSRTRPSFFKQLLSEKFTHLYKILTINQLQNRYPRRFFARFFGILRASPRISPSTTSRTWNATCPIP